MKPANSWKLAPAVLLCGAIASSIVACARPMDRPRDYEPGAKVPQVTAAQLKAESLDARACQVSLFKGDMDVDKYIDVPAADVLKDPAVLKTVVFCVGPTASGDEVSSIEKKGTLLGDVPYSVKGEHAPTSIEVTFYEDQVFTYNELIGTPAASITAKIENEKYGVVMKCDAQAACE